MHDLTWEDKELVLRLLFAKINGTNKGINQVIARTRGAVEGDLSVIEDDSTVESSTLPVFVSEGKGMPPDDSYHQHFAVNKFTEHVTGQQQHQNFAIPYQALQESEEENGRGGLGESGSRLV